MNRRVAVFVLLLAGCSSQAWSQTPAAAKNAAPWVGSWLIVTERDDDKEEQPAPFPMKIVITPELIHFYGSKLKYVVDTKTTPHTVVTTDYYSSSEPPRRALLEIKGDQLRLCVPSDDKTELKSFQLTAGQKAISSVCRRAPDVATAKLVTPEEVDAGILECLREVESLLAKKDYQAYYERFITPGDRIGTPKEFAERCDPKMMEEHRVLFAAMLRIRPKMSSNGRIAIYNLAEWHIPGGLIDREFMLQSAGGKWYYKL